MIWWHLHYNCYFTFNPSLTFATSWCSHHHYCVIERCFVEVCEDPCLVTTFPRWPCCATHLLFKHFDLNVNIPFVQCFIFMSIGHLLQLHAGWGRVLLGGGRGTVWGTVRAHNVSVFSQLMKNRNNSLQMDNFPVSVANTKKKKIRG